MHSCMHLEEHSMLLCLSDLAIADNGTGSNPGDVCDERSLLPVVSLDVLAHLVRSADR